MVERTGSSAFVVLLAAAVAFAVGSFVLELEEVEACFVVSSCYSDLGSVFG